MSQVESQLAECPKCHQYFFGWDTSFQDYRCINPECNFWDDRKTPSPAELRRLKKLEEDLEKIKKLDNLDRYGVLRK